MPHQLADGDVGFSVAPELRPELSDGCVVGDQPSVDEAVDDGGRHTLGRGEHHAGRVGRPGHPATPIGVARPHVDDWFPVEIDRERTPTESAAVEGACEAAHSAGEMWIGRAMNTTRQHRPAITHHFEGHTVEPTVSLYARSGYLPIR